MFGGLMQLPDSRVVAGDEEVGPGRGNGRRLRHPGVD